MPDVYIAAGSNVEPLSHLTKASGELRRLFPGVRFSSWYRNRAVGFDGEDFINFVAGFTTALEVHELIALLRSIERSCGRPPGAPRWAPRTMDLDMLLYGQLVCDEPGLKLPRPDLLKRAYMLGPLAELAPQVIHPTAARTMGELWQQFDRAAHPLYRVPGPPADAPEPTRPC